MRKLFIFIITYFILYFLGVLVMSIPYILDLIKFKSFNILAILSSNSFLLMSLIIFFALLIFYLFIIVSYLLYRNIKRKEINKIIIFSIFFLILGFFIFQSIFLIFLSEKKGTTAVLGPNNFRTNQITEKCEFGKGANMGGGLNLKWYHKKGCEDYKEVKIEDSIKEKYLDEDVRDKIFFMGISKENKNYNFFIYNGDNLSKEYETKLLFPKEVVNISKNEKIKKLSNQNCGEIIISEYGDESEELLVNPFSMRKVKLFSFEEVNLNSWECTFIIQLNLLYKKENVDSAPIIIKGRDLIHLR